MKLPARGVLPPARTGSQGVCPADYQALRTRPCGGVGLLVVVVICQCICPNMPALLCTSPILRAEGRRTLLLVAPFLLLFTQSRYCAGSSDARPICRHGRAQAATHEACSVSDARPKHCMNIHSEAIASKIQLEQRGALPQHRQQPPCPFNSYAIALQIELGE